MAKQSDLEVEVDLIEIQKKFNFEEPKYPLDYDKYIKIKKD